MKTLFSFLLFGSIISSIYAKEVDVKSAEIVAKKFYEAALTRTTGSKSFVLPEFSLVDSPMVLIERKGAKGPSNEILYYVYNVGNNNGFVIVAGDDLINPIMAYSFDGQFSVSYQSKALQNWLMSYKREIVYAKENSLKPSNYVIEKWDNYFQKGPLDPVMPIVGPLLGKNFEWGQDGLFNDYCPTYSLGNGNSFCPAGCGAITLGQIMKYYNYPNQGIDLVPYIDKSNQQTNSCSFTMDETQREPESSDFVIDWYKIQTGALYTEIDAAEKTARLVYNIGVSLKMDYGPCESTSTIQALIDALTKNFSYANSLEYKVTPLFGPDQEWINLLKNEINEGRPIAYFGDDLNNILNPFDDSKHSFICEGYDNADHFYFNWGSSGFGNGYFALTLLDFDNYNDITYTNNQKAVIGIKLPPDIREPNNSEEQHSYLPPASLCLEGNIDVLNDEDYFRMDLPIGKNYNVSAYVNDLSHNTSNVFYSGNVKIQYKNTVWSQIEDYNVTPFTVYNGGSIYFKIFGEGTPASGNTGTYGLNISIEQIGNPSLSDGKTTPSQALTNENVEFSVNYKDPANLTPQSARVCINSIYHNMSPTGSDFIKGVKYVYTQSFGNTGTVPYYFTATANDGSTITSTEQTLNVAANPSGWEIDVPYLNASPDYMMTPKKVMITAKVHNNSDHFDKVYTNVPYKFLIFYPNGSLLTEKSGQIASLNQGITTSITTDFTPASTYGVYKILFSIFPPLDGNLYNNSLNCSVIVGEEGPSHQFYIPTEQAKIELSASYLTHSFNNHTYTLKNLTSSYIDISQDYSESYGRIPVQDFREYNNGQDVLRYRIMTPTPGARVSFGYSNTNYVTFTYTNITCKPGDEIEFAAHSDYEIFGTNTLILRNETVKSWHYHNTTNDERDSAFYQFRVQSNALPQVYSFFVAVDFYNSNASFLRELKITVLPNNPVISSLSSNEFSADDQITINGDYLESSGTIKFNDITCTEIISWSTSTITCIIPEGVTDGIVTVTNQNGISNGLAYHIISSTGDPVIAYHIPDQEINPGETKYIANLRDIFSDPNNDNLYFSATSNNPDISIDQTKLQNDTLVLIASQNILNNSVITISAKDNDNVTVTDQFIIQVPPRIEISPLSANVNFEVGSYIYTVLTNRNWSVSESADWLTVSKPENSKIKVDYNKNILATSRSANITVYADNIEPISLLFSQEGAEPFLVVNPLHLNVPNTSGQEVVKVSSNAVWNLFEDVEWLIAIKTNDTTATISYNENLAAERSAQIIVSSPYLSPDTIKVIQGSNNAQLTVTPGLINLNYMIGSSGYFEISSNISWITSSNQTWLETSPASGTNNGTISVTAKSANTGTDSRNAEVTITGGGLTRIVTVTQVGTSANPCEPVFTEYFDNFSNWNPASNNGLNCSWTSVNGYAKIASMGNNPSGWIEAVYEKNLPQSIPSGTDFVLKAFIKVMDDDPSGSVSGVGVNLVDSDGNMVCRINFNDSQAASGYGGLQYSAGDDMVYTNDPNGFSTNNPTLNGLLELRRVGTTWTAFLDGQQLGSPKVFDVQRTATRVQITNSRYQNYGYRDGEIDYIHLSKCGSLTNILSANVVSPLVKAFPNPTNGIILIEFYEVDKINKIEYTINDGEGRFLEKRNSPVINTRSVELNFHDFKNGIYFVNIVLNNKTRISVKVVKY